MRVLPHMLRMLALSVPLLAISAEAAQSPGREIIAQAAVANKNKDKRDIINSLAGVSDDAIAPLFDAWKQDRLFIYEAEDGELTPIEITGDANDAGLYKALRVIDGELVTDPSGAPVLFDASDLDEVGHNGMIRRAMKGVLDLMDLGSPDPVRRLNAVQKIGQSQKADKLPVLLERAEVEENPKVARGVKEAISLVQLKDPDPEVRIAALNELAELHTLASYDFINTARMAAEEAGENEVVAAAVGAMKAVDGHRRFANFFGTIFRGISLGSILLVVALGLAITFGLMGVINMAHGEMIAVGAYTTYLVQNVFGAGVTIPFFGMSLPFAGMGLSGWAYESYFLFALPISFFAAAIVGIGLERSVIRFLYRRPLESLLATWGVSLLLQQVFRLMFGANNVQVSSPAYLSGNWTIADIIFGWNRVFVIVFALLIVFGVWLVLTKTPLGLLMRAVMQNRQMASCMGVRTERVNMLTFGIGSGLAGLAGAFLSQIGNVGPSLGQSYIVDSFMVVVVGGVGNIAGTVISAFTIGGIDQILQQYLPAWAPGLGWVPLIGSFLQNLAQDSSVFGKILVLGGIILFLQWRPAGIFVTRSRGLES